MIRLSALLTALLLVVPAVQAEDATAVANEVLKTGSALFDARDAAGLAATYAENGAIALFLRDKNDGSVKLESRQGAQEIKAGYADLFKDMAPSATCSNLLHAAEFLTPDLLLMRGTFKPDSAQDISVTFVQVRTKQEGKWKVLSMQVLYGF